MRFGDPFEFGWHYQLAMPDPHSPDTHMLNWDKLIINLYLYLLRPLGFHIPLVFPYFNTQLDPVILTLPIPIYVEFTVQEPVYGIMANTPFSLFALASPYLFLKTTKLSPRVRFVAAAALVYGLAHLLLDALYIVATQRYLLDFLPFFMLVACITFAIIIRDLHGRQRTCMLAIGVCMGFYGMLSDLLAACYKMPLCQ